MKRIALLALVLAMLFVGSVLLWRRLDQPLYSQAISHRCKLIVRITGSSHNTTKLYVTFHYPPAIGMYGFKELELENTNGGFQFASVMDETTQLQCVYDSNRSGFIFIYDHKSDDEWITGDPTGYAHSPTLWTDRFKSIKKSFPTIPYDELPARQ